MPKILNNLDLNQNEIQNVVLHKLATAPSNPKVGQTYFNTTDNNIYRWNGTAWVTYQAPISTTSVSTVSIPNGIVKGDGSTLTAAVAGTDYQAPLPSQSGNSGKFLTTNGTTLSWGSVDALPSQSGNSGKFLTTNGSTASWSAITASAIGAAASSHTHGDITNDGDIVDTNAATIASGDRLVINDESESKLTNSSITFGTSTTKYLANDGTWQDLPVDSDTQVTQTNATYSSYTYWRSLPVGYSSVSGATSATSTTTGSTYTFPNLKFQPSTGTLRTHIYQVIPTAAGTTASANQMASDSTNNIYFRVNNGADTVMTLYSNGTILTVRPGGQFDDMVDLGTSTIRWKNIYASGTIYGNLSGTATQVSNSLTFGDSSDPLYTYNGSAAVNVPIYDGDGSDTTSTPFGFFTVNLTYDDNDSMYYADKTAANILAAAQAGQPIYLLCHHALYNNQIILSGIANLVYNNSNQLESCDIEFTSITETGNYDENNNPIITIERRACIYDYFYDAWFYYETYHNVVALDNGGGYEEPVEDW